MRQYTVNVKSSGFKISVTSKFKGIKEADKFGTEIINILNPETYAESFYKSIKRK